MYGYYGYGLYDPTMILVLIGAVLSLWASAKVKNTFNRYSSVRRRDRDDRCRGSPEIVKFPGNL